MAWVRKKPQVASERNQFNNASVGRGGPINGKRTLNSLWGVDIWMATKSGVLRVLCVADVVGCMRVHGHAEAMLTEG